MIKLKFRSLVVAKEERTVMKYFSSKLWKNKRFNFLWGGTTVSLIGTQVSNLALPMVALIILNAGAMEVGILKAAENVAFPLLGLFAGVMADRLNPRRIMIAADISRFLLLSIVPLAYVLGILNIYVLLFVATTMGVSAVFYNISFSTYVAHIVDREELVEGNSKLNVSESIAQFIGPMLGGSLIAIIGAVKSLLIDVMSYLFSVVTLFMAKQPQQPNYVIDNQQTKAIKGSIGKDIKEGLVFVLSSKTLRTLTIATGFANLGHSITQPMLLVYAYKRLGLGTEQMGIILAIGSIGIFLGALIASKISQRFGLGKSLFFSMGFVGIAAVILPVAILGNPVIVLSMSWFMICFADMIYNINQFTLRQLLTPIELQGRMNATVRLVIFGVMPIGSVLGGAIATYFGAAASLVVGGAAYLMVPLIVYVSHLYSMQQQPEPLSISN